MNLLPNLLRLFSSSVDFSNYPNGRCSHGTFADLVSIVEQLRKLEGCHEQFCLNCVDNKKMNSYIYKKVVQELEL